MIFDEPRGIFGHFNFDAFQIILFKGIIESQNTPLLSLCKGPKCDLVGYPTEQARWSGGRARPFGISAKRCIFPLVQQGQTVMSIPVS